MKSNDETTIIVSTREKCRLDKRKLYTREPYRDVVKRVLDEVDRYEESGKAAEEMEIKKAIDRAETALDRIVKGRLAKWFPSDRSHDKILLAELTKKHE